MTGAVITLLNYNCFNNYSFMTKFLIKINEGRIPTKLEVVLTQQIVSLDGTKGWYHSCSQQSQGLV